MVEFMLYESQSNKAVTRAVGGREEEEEEEEENNVSHAFPRSLAPSMKYLLLPFAEKKTEVLRIRIPH